LDRPAQAAQAAQAALAALASRVHATIHAIS